MNNSAWYHQQAKRHNPKRLKLNKVILYIFFPTSVNLKIKTKNFIKIEYILV